MILTLIGKIVVVGCVVIIVYLAMNFAHRLYFASFVSRGWPRPRLRANDPTLYVMLGASLLLGCSLGRSFLSGLGRSYAAALFV